MTHKGEWREGYPKEIGPYDCELNGKHRWMTLQGGDVIAAKILWRGKITDFKKMK